MCDERAPLSLATLDQYSAQEVFNHVVNHLRQQKTKSMDASRLACLYRGPEGRKCAAGCLIADDEYEPSLERQSWRHLVQMQRVPCVHVDLIAELQNAHDLSWVDDNDALNDLEPRLALIAIKFGLIYTGPVSVSALQNQSRPAA